MTTRVLSFYLATMLLLVVLGGGSQALGFPPEIGVAQWAPGVAALCMLVAFRRDSHRITGFTPASPPSRYAWAIALPVIAAASIYVALKTPGIGSRGDDDGTAFVVDRLWLFALWTPLGALGEEIGWRGYLQKHLAAHREPLVACGVTGILWASIHLHLFGNGAVYILCLTAVMVAYSIVLHALTADVGFSVPVATVFHTAVNYTNMLFLDVLNATAFMAANAAAWSVIAIAVIVRRKPLFFTPPPAP